MLNIGGMTKDNKGTLVDISGVGTSEPIITE
jgi:hypothetical protein